MSAEILFAGEIEDLAGRVTNAVVDVLHGLTAQVTAPELRTAVEALVLAARHQLAGEPVDPAPMVRAILRRAVGGGPLQADEEDEFGVALTPALKQVAAPTVVTPPVADDAALPTVSTELVVIAPDPVAPQQVASLPLPSSARPAPSYWPAVPVISDELFTEYTANQERNEARNEEYPNRPVDSVDGGPGVGQNLEHTTTPGNPPPAPTVEDPHHHGAFHAHKFGRKHKTSQQ